MSFLFKFLFHRKTASVSSKEEGLRKLATALNLLPTFPFCPFKLEFSSLKIIPLQLILVKIFFICNTRLNEQPRPFSFAFASPFLPLDSVKGSHDPRTV